MHDNHVHLCIVSTMYFFFPLLFPSLRHFNIKKKSKKKKSEVSLAERKGGHLNACMITNPKIFLMKYRYS